MFNKTNKVRKIAKNTSGYTLGRKSKCVENVILVPRASYIKNAGEKNPAQRGKATRHSPILHIS